MHKYNACVQKPVACTQGCGLTVPKDEMVEHHGVRELRLQVKDQADRLAKHQQAIKRPTVD